MSIFSGRWHTPMTTDVSKLDDYGNAQSEFGDEDGDHPPKADRTNVIGILRTEEVIDIDKPENITIIKRDPES